MTRVDLRSLGVIQRNFEEILERMLWIRNKILWKAPDCLQHPDTEEVFWWSILKNIKLNNCNSCLCRGPRSDLFRLPGWGFCLCEILWVQVSWFYGLFLWRCPSPLWLLLFHLSLLLRILQAPPTVWLCASASVSIISLIILSSTREKSNFVWFINKSQ